MMTVFISGSIKIKHIHSLVLERIENITGSSFRIIVGDADGVDVAVQKYLLLKSYQNVVVYCSGMVPRNNLGGWTVEPVLTEEKVNSRKFYTAKDIEMANRCDIGLMIWDSYSTGTLSNVFRLLQQGKKSLVFVNKSKTFITIDSIMDFEHLVSLMSESGLQKADKKISLRKSIAALKQETLF